MRIELPKLVGQLPDFPDIGSIYLVGGSLRDRILNRRSNDYDFAVDGNARFYAQRVAAELGVRVIEMGKEEYVVFRVVSGDHFLDFSPVRGRTIRDDLRSRDFTINALALDLSSETLIDPVDGLRDIKSRTIRLISEDAILADPLRLLRAFRLSAVLGFEIAPQTLSLIKGHAGLVLHPAGERIRAELFRMMGVDRSYSSLRKMADAGLVMTLISELEPCLDGPPDDHGANVFDHVMRAYEEMELLLIEYPMIWPEYARPIHTYLEQDNRKVLLKWAALLHDLGKPVTRNIDSAGRLRYLTHEEKGAVMAASLCMRLRMSGQERSYVELMVRNHLHPLHLFDARQRGVLTTRGLVRFVRKYEDHVMGLLLHSFADQRAKAGHSSELQEAFVAFLTEIFNRYFGNFRPTMKAARLITGKDLIRYFGLRPSRLFGRLLHRVEEDRLNGEIRTREEAFKLVARLLEMEGDAGIEPATPSSGGLCSIR